MSIAMILAMILLIAMAKIFVWLNGSIVHRQRLYEETRVAAGRQPVTNGVVNLADPATIGEVVTDDTDYPELNIFE